MTNLGVRIFWQNSPIPLDSDVSPSEISARLPLGVLITDPEANGGSGSIYSVNGKTGSSIILNASDVGAEALGSVIESEIRLTNSIEQLSENLQSELATKANTSDLDALNNLLDEVQISLTEEISTKADSIAVIQALSTKADLINGVNPASQLPSFVDDVLEYPSWNQFPALGESGKIYVDTTDNKTYRWSGSSYVVIGGGGVALGETSATAYRGDRGKIAYDHALSSGNAHGATTSDIPEGTNQYFTPARVRVSSLFGLTEQTPSIIDASNTVLVAFGKLQAQVLQRPVEPTWIDVKTIAGVTLHTNVNNTNTLLEVAKIHGNLWIRGLITFTGAGVSEGYDLIALNNSSYGLANLVYTVGVTNNLGPYVNMYGASNAQNTSSAPIYSLMLKTRSNVVFPAWALVTTYGMSAQTLRVVPTCIGKLA